ncbi:MAG: HigA family addiction module antidote protein, partial [Alphaproteobacteria bacterium]|nr:HigA family addiction module antidote protein [Alphaproteobacteria bacterium]
MDDIEELAAERPNRCPSHPGKILRDSVLPALRLNVKDAAAELRISRQTLHRILAGEGAITPHMAVRLGKFCGNGPRLWLRMQQAHDLWLAEKALEEELKHIPSHAD